MFGYHKDFLMSGKNGMGKLSLATSLFWTLLFYLLTGIEWDFYDGFVTNFPSGYLTGEPYGDFYIYGFALMSYLYAFLHTVIQPVPWFSLFSLFFFLAGTSIITSTLLNLLQSRVKKQWHLFVIGSVVFLLLFVSSLTALSLTGISFLCCGIALIGISRLGNYRGRNAAYYISFLIVYTWGFLMRFESGLGGSLIVGVFIILTANSFKQILKILLPPALIALSILYYVQQIAKSVPFLYNTEAAMVYVADGVNDPDYYSGKSAKDSIKIRAVKGFFMNDEEELTEAFINNLSKYKAQAVENVHISWVERIQKAWAITLPCIKADLTGCLLNILLLMMLLWLYINFKFSFRTLAALVLFQLFFWLVVFAVAYWVKMEYRHFSPMMQLYSICNLLFLFYRGSVCPVSFSAPTSRIFFVVVILLLGFKLQGAAQKSSETKQTLKIQEEAVREVNKIAKGKILLLDVNSRQIVHGTVSSVVKFPDVKKILFYDMGELPIIPGYKKILDEACDCNSSRMKDFYRYLYQNRNDVVVISADSRVELISGYLRLVHNSDYRFVKMEGDYTVSNVLSSGGKLNYYVIQ
jgi:hypothetical protein